MYVECPTEINLFYINSGIRERIIEDNRHYIVNNTSIKWSRSEIIEEVNLHPEHFSPNVLLRPLYQEVILPNLCYIGGGGEIAYWFQLKHMFQAFKVPFPMIKVRNSVLLMTQKQFKTLQKLNLSIHDLFKGKFNLLNLMTQKRSELQLDFSYLKASLSKQFNVLNDIANKTDKSFLGALSAQERKQIKGIEKLEKRLLRAEKKVHASVLKRVENLYDSLFPKEKLQERNQNFSEWYVSYGKQLFDVLNQDIEPFKQEFLVIVFDD